MGFGEEGDAAVVVEGCGGEDAEFSGCVLRACWIYVPRIRGPGYCI